MLTQASGTVITFATGVTAYLLGLRHAFDADHITAIDNTSRKILAEGRKPHSTGLFFALGHSSVVVLVTALLSLGMSVVASSLKDDHSAFHLLGSLIGGSVSGVFLILVAAMNAALLVSLVRVMKGIRAGTHDDTDIVTALDNRGLIARLLRPLTKSIDKPWKMYPLGFLFGLGFDTATSIALMVMASTSVLSGSSFWAALSVPLIFTSGMALGDSLDGILMTHAYSWALARPVRRVWYNLVVTAISVLAALIIGVPILAGVAVNSFHLDGPVLNFLASIPLDNLGYVLIGVFVAVWACFSLAWRIFKIEERYSRAA
jgi:high-affinity nickel-transport protein